MDAAAELGRLLGPLRRAVLRRTRALAELPDLPEAQIELLRLLEREPGMGVNEVAARLRIAPSTVSNLLRVATSDGLIERRSSPSDLRAVQLYPSAQALKLLRRYDKVSHALLGDAIARLSAEDRKLLELATPVLGRLVEELDGEDRGRERERIRFPGRSSRALSSSK
jgi:DNA-binding MarR family transcriptional regulator